MQLHRFTGLPCSLHPAYSVSLSDFPRACYRGIATCVPVLDAALRHPSALRGTVAMPRKVNSATVMGLASKGVKQGWKYQNPIQGTSKPCGQAAYRRAGGSLELKVQTPDAKGRANRRIIRCHRRESAPQMVSAGFGPGRCKDLGLSKASGNSNLGSEGLEVWALEVWGLGVQGSGLSAGIWRLRAFRVWRFRAWQSGPAAQTHSKPVLVNAFNDVYHGAEKYEEKSKAVYNTLTITPQIFANEDISSSSSDACGLLCLTRQPAVALRQS